MSTRAVRTWTPFLIVLLVVMAVLVGFFSAARRPDSAAPLPPEANLDPEDRAASMGMKQVPDANAAAEQAGHMVMSGRSIGSEQYLSTWVSPSGEEVLEIYESGLTILTEVPEIGPDPVKYYEAVVAGAARPSVYLTKVNEVPALAVEPNTDSLASNPGLVRFEADGLSVVVSGEGKSVSYLIGVATSLRPIGKTTE